MSEAELLAENARLKRDLAAREEALHRKNIELDALHFVWCSGGCDTGVHRMDGLGPAAITREIVQAAIRNTDRLIDWYRGHEFKRQWRDLDVDLQTRWREDQRELVKLQQMAAR